MATTKKLKTTANGGTYTEAGSLGSNDLLTVDPKTGATGLITKGGLAQDFVSKTDGIVNGDIKLGANSAVRDSEGGLLLKKDTLVKVGQTNTPLYLETSSEITATRGSSTTVTLLDTGNAPSKFDILNGNLDMLMSGIFVLYHSKGSNYRNLVTPRAWTAQQNAGEIADGVAVLIPGRVLVVAPTESATELHWSSTNLAGGGTVAADGAAALADLNGQANTAAQLQKTQCQGTSYAPGFCAAYERVNANGQGITAGKWWLPSMGELEIIYANRHRINYALSLISGATQIPATKKYWASTEKNNDVAYIMYMSITFLGNNQKTSFTASVRPVSGFVV